MIWMTQWTFHDSVSWATFLNLVVLGLGWAPGPNVVYSQGGRMLLRGLCGLTLSVGSNKEILALKRLSPFSSSCTGGRVAPNSFWVLLLTFSSYSLHCRCAGQLTLFQTGLELPYLCWFAQVGIIWLECNDYISQPGECQLKNLRCRLFDAFSSSAVY